MVLSVIVHGRSCDLALHPVSEKTAKMVRRLGTEVYREKPLRWWRKGNTATWGMKIDDECNVRVEVDGKAITFDSNRIIADPLRLRRRMYLDSKARYLCVLGYDNEICKFQWTWDNIGDFNPDKFDFMVHKWDRIMGVQDYYILDEIRYNGEFADRHDWCDASGFTLTEPRLIDLDEVRKIHAGTGLDPVELEANVEPEKTPA